MILLLFISKVDIFHPSGDPNLEIEIHHSIEQEEIPEKPEDKKDEEVDKDSEELKNLMSEIDKLEEIKQKLEQKIAANNPDNKTAKNLAVNKNQHLKDDRNTDADKLYRDAAKLREELEKGKNRDIYKDDPDDGIETGGSPEDDNSPPYIGESVLSYSLDGRNAKYLTNPVYKCYAGGEVTVTIYVRRDGSVKEAKINENASATDECIRKQAKEAAKKSRFSRSDSAPEPQVGEIVYRFQAQ